MESHLLQMRGLKPNILMSDISNGQVASFTDAWIETMVERGDVTFEKVASFTDAWIETSFRARM